MKISLSHIALFVPDLRAAEAYYRTLFDMQLIGREAPLDDGLWYTLPFDMGWDDAEAAGVKLGMLALRNEDFVLALFLGDAPPGQVFSIGLSMPEAGVAGVRDRLPAETEVLDDGPDALVFRDPYQIEWQITLPGRDFQTSGDFADRWIQLGDE
jgi:catechol 2,3-dioxygenase-like lactoylglutathione lyase family enzyme